MIEIRGKNITLRTATQKEMRAFWRKYEPENKNSVWQAYTIIFSNENVTPPANRKNKQPTGRLSPFVSMA